jgi:hypothetical protein
MLNRLRNTLLPAVLVLGSMGISAHAGSVTFNFNSLAENATAAQIQTYMTSTLQAVCATCTVTIAGAYADTTYGNNSGNNHVVGPSGKALTLGTSDGATSNSDAAAMHSAGTYDTFLGTVNDADNSSDNEITLVFTGLSVTNAAFDYEIFPDASDTGAFTLTAGNNGGSQSTVFTQNGLKPSATGTDGTSTRSPASNPETIVQYIGTGSWAIASDNDIDFVDWPEAIGIDNLVLTYKTPTVPEPSSIVLLASVGAFLLFKARRSFAVRGKNQQPLA